MISPLFDLCSELLVLVKTNGFHTIIQSTMKLSSKYLSCGGVSFEC